MLRSVVLPRWLVLLALLCPAVQLFPATPAGAAPRAERLRPYEGLGAWVDVYDPRVW